MYFKPYPDYRLHPHPVFHENGRYYTNTWLDKESDKRLLFGVLCINCGWPIAVHLRGGTVCPDVIQASSIIQDLRAFKYLNLNIKIL